jgi:hypothetical protein
MRLALNSLNSLKKDWEILLHAGNPKERQVRSWLLSLCLCVYLEFILREYLVPVKCQFLYIKWVQMVRPFPRCAAAQIPSISQAVPRIQSAGSI